MRGYDVCIANNGALGIQKAFEYKPNVILCNRYTIYIFESNSTIQKLVGEDISVQEVTVSGLDNSITYFWYVVAKYDGNKVAFSPTWSFKTIAK